jgi:hypothetical protein
LWQPINAVAQTGQIPREIGSIRLPLGPFGAGSPAVEYTGKTLDFLGLFSPYSRLRVFYRRLGRRGRKVRINPTR